MARYRKTDSCISVVNCTHFETRAMFRSDPWHNRMQVSNTRNTRFKYFMGMMLLGMLFFGMEVIFLHGNGDCGRAIKLSDAK